MFSEADAAQVIGTTAYDNNGNKIGKVGQVFLDDQTGRPEFMTVNTGLFGNSESFVPAEGASIDGDRVTVPYAKDQIKDAPKVDLDGGHLDASDEQRLYQHYNMGAAYDTTDTTRGTDTTVDNTAGMTTGRTTTEGHDTSGPTTDDAMTRSEERLNVGTTQEEAGRARLRKYVTTESETVTVPVRKERAVLETEPITDANRGDAHDGPDISEEEHEVVLNEERPVVSTTTEAVERVRLGTETVTEEETVTGEVRKENIETEGDLNDRR